MIDALKELFTRDLNRLKKEIQLYKDDETLWKVENSISNSGGNLCLHLIGNLKTFIGNGLSQNGYERKRDHEFSAKNIDRNEIYKEIDETIVIVEQAFQQMGVDQLEQNFPILIWEKETGMKFTIIHLHSHLNYHLGQINYHRRLLEKS